MIKNNPFANIHFDFTTKTPLAVVMQVDSVRRIALVSKQGGIKEWLPFAGGGSGSFGEGEFSLAPSGRGWMAIVEERQGGKGYITAFVDPGSFYADEKQIDKSSASDGKLQETHDSISGQKTSYRSYKAPVDSVRRNYRNNKFYDLIPGDWGIRGVEGNYLGVLRGGVNVMATSKLNQIIQFLENDLLRVVNRNFEHFTDWGVVKISNEKGKTKLHMKANSGDNPNTNTREETYEFEMEIGHADNIKKDNYFFTLSFLPKGGKEKLTLTWDRKGEIMLNAPDNVVVSVADNYGNAVGKRYTVKAGTEIDMTVGSERMIIDSGLIKLGTAGEKTIVQSPHLDKYNALVQDCIACFTPLIAVGAPPNIVGGLAAHIDNTNKTKDVVLS